MKYLTFILVLFCAFLSGLLIKPAHAADPFLSDSNGGGSYAGEIVRKKESLTSSQKYSGATAELPNAGVGEVKKTAFKGTIDKLVNKKTLINKRRSSTWTGFRGIEGTEAETKYYNSSEYKVLKELSKPIPKRKAFGNKLDSVENTLRRTRPKKRSIVKPVNNKTDSFFSSSGY